MSRLKCVARWRRSSVLLGGMFSSKAMVSTLNRGSRTWRQRSLLGLDTFRRESPLPWKTKHWTVSPSGLRAHRCLSGWERIQRGPQTAATPSPYGWSIGKPLLEKYCSIGTENRQRKKNMLSYSTAFEDEYVKHNNRLLSPVKIIFRWMHLVRWPTTQAVGLIAVKSEHLDSSLDTEVMQDTSHFQRKQVILRDKVRHQWLNSNNKAKLSWRSDKV